MSEPLMMLPDSARRHAEQAAEAQRTREPPAWMQRLKPAEIDAVLSLFPRCTVRNRAVEWLAWTSDPATPDIIQFTVRCHGAEEITKISRDQALQGIAGAEAFATPAIAESPP